MEKSPHSSRKPGPTSLFEIGRAAFPGIELEEAIFSVHLSRTANKPPEAIAALSHLFVEDLYLACACAARAPGAAEAFKCRYGGTIKAALSALSVVAGFREDVEQQVYEDLLIGRSGSAPRILGYGGHGPLARWVTVVAQRTALMSLRSEASRARVRDAAAFEQIARSIHPETQFLQKEYVPLVNQTLAQVLAELPPRDRLVLHLHVVGGAGVKQIGAIYGVSASTAWRWLAGTRREILKRTQERLRDHLRLTTNELDSLMALVTSQLDVSVSDLLAP